MKDAVEIPNLECRNGWWHCDFVDPSGRRIRQALKTKDEKIARQRLMKMQTEAYEKGYFEMKRPVKMLFSELAGKVLEYTKDRKKSHDKFYVPFMKPLLRFFGSKYLHEITANLVTQYQTARKEAVAPATVNRELAILKRSFNLGIQWGLARLNPVKGVEFFKEPRGRVRFLTIEEINCLLDCCNGYIRGIVLVALHTGMRKSEILNLQWSNIDMANKLIVIDRTKNDEVREIPMSKAVYEMLLEKYRQKARSVNEYVFPNESGGAYWDVKRAFARVLKLANIKSFRFHDLRHTCASQLVMSGAHILAVKELLGHKDIKTTLIYAHLAPSHKRQAIERFEDYLSHKNDTNAVPEVTQNGDLRNCIENTTNLSARGDLNSRPSDSKSAALSN